MAQFTTKPGFHFDPVPPKEALEYFRAKGWKIGFDYRDVWREEHAYAFTVAKAMNLDVLQTIRGEVDRALAEGRTFRQFQKDLTPMLQKQGWWGVKDATDPKTGETRPVQLGSPRRLRTIYRTNLRTARAAGQWERIQRTKRSHPFLRYSLGPSREHREEHVRWNGLLLPADDAWWTTHMPPNGWGCKCRVRQVSRGEAEGLGGPGKAPKIKKRRWLNKRTGKTAWVPEGIDPGWDHNPGAARAAHLTKTLAEKLEAVPAAQDAIPLLTEERVMARQVGPARGTNPGGLYEGGDGVQRYVKLYDDPAQAYGEAVANAAYRALAIDAPETGLFVRADKVAVATRFIDGAETLGKAGLNKARAEQLLDGFAADVWLANWDAVGLELDNVLVAGRKVVRIDQGGSLLFRARTGRKPEERLRQIAEWDGLANPARNPAYAKVFRAAGLNSSDELGRKGLAQIKAIEDLGKRTRNFEDLVPPVPGVPEKDRLAVLELLRNRAKLLGKEIAPRIRDFLKAPKDVRELKALLGSQYQSLLDSAKRRVGQAGGGRRGLTDPELVSLHAYTGSWFVPLNEALRGIRGKEELRRVAPMVRLASKGLDKLPDTRGTLNRGTRLPDDELALHQPGSVVPHKGFTSASTGRGFGGPHRFTIESIGGKNVKWLSAHPGEDEILFKPGTKFKVLTREDRGSEVRFRVMEVD